MVATREGGVDRNTPAKTIQEAEKYVATREGGVDRNAVVLVAGAIFQRVATREGGVDRNAGRECSPRRRPWSPPARVAWIETCGPMPT